MPRCAVQEVKAMSPRRRDIYRRRKRWYFPVALAVGIPLVLIAIALILFFSLQKYAVYTRDGVTLAIPGLTMESPDVTDESDSPNAPDAPTPINPVDVEIVVKEADYSEVDLQPGQDLGAVRGRYIRASQFSALATVTAATEEAAALVLEMKTPEGVLSWASASEIAQGYGVNGQADLQEMASALKDKGYYLVAELNCCRDTLLAKRSPSLSLKNAADEPYTDERGGWLDPYGMDMRNYLLSLMEELADAGFDEILLLRPEFPAQRWRGLLRTGPHRRVHPARGGFRSGRVAGEKCTRGRHRERDAGKERAVRHRQARQGESAGRGALHPRV